MTIRLFLATPIPTWMASRHHHLAECCRDLRFSIGLRRDEGQIAGFVAHTARRLMDDVGRLVAREPGGRTLMRLPPADPVPIPLLQAALADAAAALDAFHETHSDRDSDHPDGWVIIGDDDRDWPRDD